MPRFDNNTEIMNIPNSSFTFSAVRPDKLEATEYTLVTIAVDISSSVTAFKDDLLKMVKSAIDGCKKSPRSENVLVRVISFNNTLHEVHGFLELNSVDSNDYQDLYPNGMTALFDATYSSLGATIAYGKNLVDQDYNVNSIIYIITDGENNKGVKTPSDIKNLVKETLNKELIDSMISVLIGINTLQCGTYLQDFKNDAELDFYLDMGDVTPAKLAKLAGFISKSVSSHSQSIGTGGKSVDVSLTF